MRHEGADPYVGDGATGVMRNDVHLHDAASVGVQFEAGTCSHSVVAGTDLALSLLEGLTTRIGSDEPDQQYL
jgi:hypothetical protein